MRLYARISLSSLDPTINNDLNYLKNVFFMKTIRQSVFMLLALLTAGVAQAQTADEVINNYIKAVGGKEKIATINSLYVESTLDVMGMQGTIKMTTLNGKGMRQDIDVMGSIMTTCYNDKEGWAINPMMGSTSAEPMPEMQYKAGKSNLWIEPLSDFAKAGYTAELQGKENVAGTECFKLKVTSPDQIASTYYFDAAKYLLVRVLNQSEMQGQMVETSMSFSDYKDTDGYLSARKMDMDMGGQFQMSMTVGKVVVNGPVDENIFKKP